VIERLSYPRLLQAGRTLGRIGRRLPVHYIPVARANMRLCLPELSDPERERLLDRHFEALGMSLCESAMTWWSSDERIVKLSSVEGVAHLEQALARGRGAIILTAHFTTLEIGARILNSAFPINVLYRRRRIRCSPTSPTRIASPTRGARSTPPSSATTSAACARAAPQ